MEVMTPRMHTLTHPSSTHQSGREDEGNSHGAVGQRGHREGDRENCICNVMVVGRWGCIYTNVDDILIM